MEQIVCSLERGTLIQKFYPRRKPEKKTLMLRRETRQVSVLPTVRNAKPDVSNRIFFLRRQVTWSSPTQNNRANFEGALELREVKEIRLGKGSKDFEKWPEETKKIELRKCFVVYYGSEFKLRSLSVVALSEKECEMWIKGLKYMVADTINAPYWLQVERWLRKEFYAMENPYETVTLKEVKSFLPKVNCKVSTGKLNEIFHEVDCRRRNVLGFDDFTRLYQKLMTASNTIQDYFDGSMQYSKNGQTVTLKELQKFLTDEQNDQSAHDEKAVAGLIREYVQDPVRDVQEPYLKIQEVRKQTNRYRYQSFSGILPALSA